MKVVLSWNCSLLGICTMSASETFIWPALSKFWCNEWFAIHYWSLLRTRDRQSSLANGLSSWSCLGERTTWITYPPKTLQCYFPLIVSNTHSAAINPFGIWSRAPPSAYWVVEVSQCEKTKQNRKTKPTLFLGKKKKRKGRWGRR